jgi:hypothetical protein
MNQRAKEWEAALRVVIGDVAVFAEKGGGVKLRSYQERAARAIVDSVLNHKGLSFVVMFPRQSGKNELQAQIEAFLLLRFMQLGGEMVKISPTWKPQNLNAMARLERALSQNAITQELWQKEWGYIYRIGKAKITFLSGAKMANIVGATASLLLEVDEAQDVDIEKYDKEIAPMAAAHNATRVFWGTAWTEDTLLAREMRLIRGEAGVGNDQVRSMRSFAPGNAAFDCGYNAPRQALRQAQGFGSGQAFMLTANEVRAEVPEYGEFVDEQVRRLGRYHPMVRSQFFSETIEAAMGLFTVERCKLMEGQHPPLDGPSAGEVYAMLMDVGGERLLRPDEADVKNAQGYSMRSFAPPTSTEVRLGASCAQASSLEREVEHDASVLTVVRVKERPSPGSCAVPATTLRRRTSSTQTSGLEREKAGSWSGEMIYEVVQRYAWVGASHASLFEEVQELALHWGVERLVVDATGLGAGLASFLERSLPGRVVKFIFSQRSKSDLGWNFLSIVETGRFRDYRIPTVGDRLEPLLCWEREGRLQEVFWKQTAACEGVVLPGLGKVLQWGVPDGRRDEAGRLMHDDVLMSAALCAALEGMVWGRGVSTVIPGYDPLAGMRPVI